MEKLNIGILTESIYGYVFDSRCMPSNDRIYYNVNYNVHHSCETVSKLRYGEIEY